MNMCNVSKNSLYEKAILNLIRQHGLVSRKKLQEYTHIRFATITEITKKLIDDGLVVENGTIRETGLKKALSINRERYRLMGMTVTKDQLLCMTIDLLGQETDRAVYPINELIGGPDFVRLVSSVYQNAVSGNPNHVFLGLGISISAAFDLERTQIVLSDRHINLRHVPLLDMLREVIQIPVFLETTNNAHMLAEKWFGQTDAESTLYVEISESIAAGIMIHNKVVRGMFGIEGELGHTIVERNGRLCTCGNRGCLETVASERVLKDTLRQMLGQGAHSMVTELCGGNLSGMTIQMIYDAAAHGDKLCTTLLEDASEYIGISVANLINLFGPGVVIFGGEGIEPDSIYVKMIIDVIKRNVFQGNRAAGEVPIQFHVSNYSAWGAALGAAALAFAHFYNSEQILSLGIL